MSNPEAIATDRADARRLMLLVRRLREVPRYREVPGMGMEYDKVGDWCRQVDIFATVEAVLRDG